MRWFLLLSLFIVGVAHAACEQPYGAFPLWLDFEKVFQKSDAPESMVPVRFNERALFVQYVRDSNGCLHTARLFDEKKETVLRSASFMWHNSPNNERLLASMRIADEKNSVLFSDSWNYGKSGKVRTRLTVEGKNRKLLRFDANGRIVKEQTKYPSCSRTNEFQYDDEDLSLIDDDVDEDIPPSGSYANEITLFSPENKITKKWAAYLDGKLCSKICASWQTNAKDQVLWIKWYPDIHKDQNARCTKYDYYADSGLIKRKVTPNGIAIDYTYDAKGHLTSLMSSDGSCSYSITYDEKDQIISVTSPRGGSLQRTYNANNNLTSETIDGLTVTYEYDSLGQLARMLLPDGSSINYTFKEKALTSLIRKDAYNTVLYECPVGAAEGKAPSKEGIQKTTQQFQFSDPLGGYQLNVSYDDTAQVTKEEGEFVKQWKFDALGYPLEMNGASPHRTPFLEPESANGYEYAYDNNGNMIRKTSPNGTYTFTYDALDRLCTIAYNDTILQNYTYDLFGRRIKSNEGRYLWDNLDEIAVLNNDTSIHALKLKAPHLVGIEIDQKLYTCTCDFRHSVCALSDPISKKPVEIYRYSAFGVQKILSATGTQLGISGVGNPWGFCGKSFVATGGLWYFGARYYDPNIASWCTPDPLVTIDGVNLKKFSQNDPMHFTDTFGLFSLPIQLSDVKNKVYTTMVDIWTRVFHTLTFARTQLDWFFETRSLFEQNAFKIIDQNFWFFAGYNPNATALYSTGQNPLDTVRLTFINGILNSYHDTLAAADALSKTHGDAKVHYIYAASNGYLGDLLHALFDKLGYATPEAKLLVTTWRQMIAEMGGPGKGGLIVHYAHSLGASDTYAALQLLTPDERKMIRIATFGSPQLIPSELCRSAMNYVSTRDPVPCFDPVGYVKGYLGFRSDITFLESKENAIIEHLILCATYFEQLQRLGNQFQAEYHPKVQFTPKGGSFHTYRCAYVTKGDPEHKPKPKPPVDQLLVSAVKAKDWQEIRRVIHKRNPPFDMLEKVGREQNSPVMQRACAAVRAIRAEDSQLGISETELFQLALFCETELSHWVKRRNNYLPSVDTQLPRDLEYDPVSKNTFIHLGTNGISAIGSGQHKTVTKSILYRTERPEIIANCETSLNDGNEARIIRKEVSIMKRVNGIPGIVEVRSFIRRIENDGSCNKFEILCKNYNSGSLRTVHYQHTPQFTFKEKVKVAYDLIQGLAGMHAKHLVHRDLHTGNFLIDIRNPQGQPREVSAVIIDFGRTMPISKCNGLDPQAAKQYRGPEGFLCHLRGKDYYATDVFAMGCVFHDVLTGHLPKWSNQSWLKNVSPAISERKKVQSRLYSVIQRATRERRVYLRNNYHTLSPMDQFEYLILWMLHPEASQRPTSAQVRSKLKVIYQQVSSQ